MPLNKAALAHPYKPAPSSASLTIPQNVQLASNMRALDRMQFDNAVALKQQLEEVYAGALLSSEGALVARFVLGRELPHLWLTMMTYLACV